MQPKDSAISHNTICAQVLELNAVATAKPIGADDEAAWHDNSFFISMLLAANNSRAEEREIWHGWLNLPDCSKSEWTNDGIFGSPSLTIRRGPQELHGYITAVGPDEILEQVKYCATKGVTAAGITAVIGSWEASYPAFKAAFVACLADNSQKIEMIRFRTENICRY